MSDICAHCEYFSCTGTDTFLSTARRDYHKVSKILSTSPEIALLLIRALHRSSSDLNGHTAHLAAQSRKSRRRLAGLWSYADLLVACSR